MTDERLWKSCGNCKHSKACLWLEEEPDDDEPCAFWREIHCPDCGGILSTVREHDGKKIRHCYACHFEFEVK